MATIPFAGCAANNSTQRRPNVVVFMADDIGLGDIGFYHADRTGHDPVVPTPNIDQLIRDGIHFSNAYAPSSLCAPTRFSMLTGNYPYRNSRDKPFGVWLPWNDPGIEPKNTTSARIAQKGGYATAFFGKWGCGGELRNAKTGQPMSKIDLGEFEFEDFESLYKAANYHGFDYALELPRGIQNGPFAFFENGNWMPLEDGSRFGRVGPDQHLVGASLPPYDEVGDSNWNPATVGPLLAAKATEYIRSHTTDNPLQPFFMYYCSQGIHVPHVPSKTFGDKPIAKTTPSSHGDMLAELDAQVGALIDCLKETHSYTDTLFVFTSDNGGLGSRWNSLAEFGHDGTNGLRGAKGAIYEGGARVPFSCTWPTVIASGSESNELVVAHDIVATIAAIADPSSPTDQVMDSLDLLPILSGKSVKESHSVILQQSNKDNSYYAIRRGKWKLIFSGSKRGIDEGLQPIALFDLANNPGEHESLNKVGDAAYQDLVLELSNLYLELRESGRATVVS